MRRISFNKAFNAFMIIGMALAIVLTTVSKMQSPGSNRHLLLIAAFGSLMGELLVVREDLWADTLRKMGNALGRFIYLLDAELDYDKDQRKGKYNPFLARGEEKDWARWEDYLVLTMGRCTAEFEKLPLVQDKALLDNILYSGVWVNYRRKRKEEERHD